MHRELQGNEISHIRCGAAEPRLVLSNFIDAASKWWEESSNRLNV